LLIVLHVIKNVTFTEASTYGRNTTHCMNLDVQYFEGATTTGNPSKHIYCHWLCPRTFEFTTNTVNKSLKQCLTSYLLTVYSSIQTVINMYSKTFLIRSTQDLKIMLPTIKFQTAKFFQCTLAVKWSAEAQVLCCKVW